jgi:glucose-1-phosphate adenylyltransferase
MNDVLCVILGGGQGKRLYPLTKERCKPAVPLFGKYRLIDIPVSNCLNSDLNNIYILTQFNSESLNRHISRTYKMDMLSKGFIDIIAANQSTDNMDWFQGTADAVRKCLRHFNDPRYKYVLVLAGDHLYKMNLREMLRYHIEKKAEVTVACNYVRPQDTAGFGIMGIDSESRIVKFVEKPKNLNDIKDLKIKDEKEDKYPGSMGIYLFNKPTLIELLTKDNKVDFGGEIIPDAIKEKDTYAFMFDGYWRDIGTIKTFYEESLRLTDSFPPLDMFEEGWQIFTRPRFLCPAKFENAIIEQSIISEGAIIMSAKIVHSIVGLRFRIASGSVIEDSIVMGCDYYQTAEEIEKDKANKVPLLGVGKDCVIKKAIIDKNVRIGDDVKIINKEKHENFDGPNYFVRDGVVIIDKNTVIPSGTVI